MSEENRNENLEEGFNKFEHQEEETEEDKEQRLFLEGIDEVHRWLDQKRVSKKKRRDFDQAINLLAQQYAEGNLAFEEDGEIRQFLKFPFENLKELRYKQRLTKDEVNPYLKGVNSQDEEERVVAFICALTKQARGVINRLDTEDSQVPDAVAVFFVS